MAVSIRWGLVKSIMGHKYAGILTAVKGTRKFFMYSYGKISKIYCFGEKRTMCYDAYICVLVYP